MRSRQALIVVAIVLALLAFIPAQARADVQFYRYWLDTYQPGLEKFTGPIRSPKDAGGTIYQVERDARGRVVHVTTIRSGKKLGETLYQFSGTSKLPSGYRYFEGGALSSMARYQRDAQGFIARKNYLTAQGDLTGYALWVHSPSQITWTNYSASGAVTSRGTSYYAANGVLNRSREYPTESSVRYYEYQYDGSTGQIIQSNKVEDGKVVLNKRYTHDSNGDRVRTDLFDPAGKPYGWEEYSGGLLRRKVYNFADGNSEELLSTYDSKRNLLNTTLAWNGKLVCTFTYDRLANGTVKRTLATGPNGYLWAEYPDSEVTDVTRDGQPVDKGLSKIYKTGNWF